MDRKRRLSRPVCCLVEECFGGSAIQLALYAEYAQTFTTVHFVEKRKDRVIGGSIPEIVDSQNGPAIDAQQRVKNTRDSEASVDQDQIGRVAIEMGPRRARIARPLSSVATLAGTAKKSDRTDVRAKEFKSAIFLRAPSRIIGKNPGNPFLVRLNGDETRDAEL